MEVEGSIIVADECSRRGVGTFAWRTSSTLAFSTTLRKSLLACMPRKYSRHRALFQLATGRAGTKGVKESPCCAKRHKRRRWSECLLNNSQVIRVCKNPQPQQQKLPRFTNNQSLSCKRARNSRGPACHSSSNPCKEGPQKLNVHGSKERSRHRCASGHSGSDFR